MNTGPPAKSLLRATTPVSGASNRRSTVSERAKDFTPSAMKLFAFRVLPVILLCVVGGSVAVLHGQQPKPKASPTPAAKEPDQEPITTFIRRVRLPITVADKKDHFITGLTKADFQIFEDKVPQQIETFSDDIGQTQQLYVGVLMDTSPSTAGKIKFEQESALNFIQTVVRPRKDRVLFATFDHEVSLRQDFTDKLD